MNDEAFAEKELDPTTTQTILVPIGCQIWDSSHFLHH
jgi:hypothetical protein